MAREHVSLNTWVRNAREIEEDGGYVDWRERYYTCPICGSDIYEDKWDPEDLEDNYCPVCLDYDEAEDEDDEYEYEDKDDEDEDEDEDDYPQNRQGQHQNNCEFLHI